jgi:fimbrial chaperone protein
MLCLSFSLGLAGQTLAASLRVAPVVLDLQAPTAASTIRIWNDARRPINVQIRVFRWSQQNGEDSYEATNDVVASPPMATLRPGGENLVRIVRTSKRPVRAEESYRLVVDELPEPSRRKAGTVALVVRHSIPVFFATEDAQGAEPAWSVSRQAGGYLVTVRNGGAKRLKVSNLTLDTGGPALGRRDGLVGYALGNSTATWFVPASGRGRVSGGSVSIKAESEAGPFHATARYRGG